MREFARVSEQVAALFEQAARPENQTRYDAELWRYYPQLKTLQGCAQETRYVYDLCANALQTRLPPITLRWAKSFRVVAIRQ